MSENTTGDEYSRGRKEEMRQHRRPKVNPRYRPVIPVVWGVGLVIAFITTLFGAFPVTTVYVILISHLFLAGLVRQDIKSIRKQGITWGLSRHVWFAATLTFPLVAPAYYVYSGRIVDRENAHRRRLQGLDEEESDDVDGDTEGADAGAGNRGGSDEERVDA